MDGLPVYHFSKNKIGTIEKNTCFWPWVVCSCCSAMVEGIFLQPFKVRFAKCVFGSDWSKSRWIDLDSRSFWYLAPWLIATEIVSKALVGCGIHSRLVHFCQMFCHTFVAVTIAYYATSAIRFYVLYYNGNIEADNRPQYVCTTHTKHEVSYTKELHLTRMGLTYMWYSNELAFSCPVSFWCQNWFR